MEEQLNEIVEEFASAQIKLSDLSDHIDGINMIFQGLMLMTHPSFYVRTVLDKIITRIIACNDVILTPKSELMMRKIIYDASITLRTHYMVPSKMLGERLPLTDIDQRAPEFVTQNNEL